MEPKKIKKLILKKETISNLSEFEQKRIIGGRIGSETDGGYNECDCYYPTEQLQCATGYGPCQITATILCYPNNTDNCNCPG